MHALARPFGQIPGYVYSLMMKAFLSLQFKYCHTNAYAIVGDQSISGHPKNLQALAKEMQRVYNMIVLDIVNDIFTKRYVSYNA